MSDSAVAVVETDETVYRPEGWTFPDATEVPSEKIMDAVSALSALGSFLSRLGNGEEFSEVGEWCYWRAQELERAVFDHAPEHEDAYEVDPVVVGVMAGGDELSADLFDMVGMPRTAAAYRELAQRIRQAGSIGDIAGKFNNPDEEAELLLVTADSSILKSIDAIEKRSREVSERLEELKR
jgi:hypothetical protein